MGKVIEEWREIEGYPMYLVSSFGRVMSCNMRYKKPRIIKGVTDDDGYQKVYISNGSSGKRVFIHRLVAIAFIPNPNNFPVINHKDEDKQNNCVDNLEWCTVRDNTVYHDMPKRRADALRIPIVQMDLNRNIVKRWRCRADIERETGFHGGNITRVCQGKRPTAHGYKWAYDKEAREREQANRKSV